MLPQKGGPLPLAIKTIRIPDETLQKYQDMHPQNPSLALEQQLERWKDLSYKERVLVFPAEVRKELEHIVGRPIEDAQDFVKWVKKALTFKVEDFELHLTDGQKKTLEGQAKFFQQPLPEFTRTKIKVAIQKEIGG